MSEALMIVSNRPLYLQVRDSLAEKIASGCLKPGSTIPSETDLAREIGVSSGTVRKALEVMERERLIVRRQGRGTFVSDPTSGDLAARFSKLYDRNGTLVCGKVRSIEITRGQASDQERHRLRLRAGADAYRVRRLHDGEGKTFLVEDSVLPAELFPGLGEEKRIADQITVLAREYGLLLGPVEERISAAVVSTPIADVLAVEPGSPIAFMDRTVFMLDRRRVVEWRLAYCYLPGSYYLAEIH